MIVLSTTYVTEIRADFGIVLKLRSVDVFFYWETVTGSFLVIFKKIVQFARISIPILSLHFWEIF